MRQQDEECFLPTNLALMAYTHKPWPSVCFGLGTMTNDVDVTEPMLDKEDYDTLNEFGVASMLKKDGENCTSLLEVWVWSVSKLNNSLRGFYSSCNTTVLNL